MVYVSHTVAGLTGLDKNWTLDRYNGKKFDKSFQPPHVIIAS